MFYNSEYYSGIFVLALQGEYVGCFPYQQASTTISTSDFSYLVNSPSAAESATNCLQQCRQSQYK